MDSTFKYVFIGHGRSTVWKDLKDFLQNRLNLEWDEFNREPTAGVSTTERLQEMVDKSKFAFIIMTAEDEHSDGNKHARENVIHEAGLFQGKLGFRKAIILLEEDCAEFSNIIGLGQIRFPKGKIEPKYEEIRKVLEREKILKK
jgi:predicted nucleotide-binding protein